MENCLRYAQPARYFEEALPLGNGALGAMVYGDPRNERISLNHDTLWSGQPRKITKPSACRAYKESRQLVREGRHADAEALLERDFTAPWSQSYMPLGNLYINCLQKGTVSEYCRTLDLQTGSATVAYTQGKNRFFRTYFVSHPDNCIVLHITSKRAADYIFSANSQLKSSLSVSEGLLCLSGECPVSVAPVYDKDSIPTIYNGEGIKFAAIGKVITNGSITWDDTVLSVTDATELTFVMCIETSFVSFDAPPTKPFLRACQSCLQKASAKPFDALYCRHTADHCALYDRVKADFGFPANQNMTDARLQAEDKSNDLGLVELLYNYGRYLLIASSREGSQATNLQGIWNEQFFPPWSSNYTLNINTEMNYWPVLMNNLAGLDMPLIDLLKKLSVTGADAAKVFYGANGYCSHHNADLWGHATPVGMQKQGCLRYAFWNMSAPWLCRHAWEHYEYTLDKEFLQNTAYPLMRDATAFVLDLLEEDGGFYTITPSTSPENSFMHPKYGRTGIAHSCTMTQAITADLFTNLIKAAAILGIDDSLIRQVQSILPQLKLYTIGNFGQLLEFNEEYPEHDAHHRHLSHLYGLYPGESITTAATPALADACRVTLEQRGDVSTGWAMGWRICLWAKLKDGDRALKLVKDQLRYVNPENTATSFCGGTYPNLLDAHPPFQIDGNFGVCAGITLMLMQCENDKIHILPALPTAFENGSVSGLKAKGDITVDIVWKNGILKQCVLTAPVDCAAAVVTPYGEQTLHLKAGMPTRLCAE